ncbi:MAG: beta-galactosidase trimerization domain-containing protein, partial [Phycisphaerae bacterium]
MIRQVEPNRQIDYMAPRFYMDGIKALATAYGGNFKDTGGMASTFMEHLPAVMRGAGLPFSVETPEDYHNLEDFKNSMAHHIAEGANGIDLAHQMGCVLWKPDVRQEFVDTLPMIKLVGKYHPPQAEVAGLYSTRSYALAEYPWNQDLNVNLTPLASWVWAWNVRSNLIGRFESDGLTESSFKAGDAARYRVIIDTNTSFMDEELLAQIEKYVRDGGTFITYAQTGRHTPVRQDAWPICQLTGYQVTRIDKLEMLEKGGNPLETRTLKPAANQNVIRGDWSALKANGLSLKKVAPEAQDLMLWPDGSTAIGSRKLGKGYIVQVGCKFTGASIPLAVEVNPSRATKALVELLSQLLQWRGVAPAQGRMVPAQDAVMVRHYLSNNGLYDIWFIWNMSNKQPATGDFTLPTPPPATSPITDQTAWLWDVQAQKQIPLTQGKLSLTLAPLQYQEFLTPRKQITNAAVDWFSLQRNWWQGTTTPSPKQLLQQLPHQFSVDLSQDWIFVPLKADENGERYLVPDARDASRDKIAMGIWSPRYPEIKHALLRRSFTVPSQWTGEPTLWLTAWVRPEFMDKGRIWLDGKMLSDWSPNGLVNAHADTGVALKAGSTHTLAVEISGQGALVGSRGNVWLWCWPKPLSSLDLAGSWSPSADALHYTEPIQLPGSCPTFTLRRTVMVPPAQSAHNVVINVEGDGPLHGVIINGHWVRRFHHLIGKRFQLNVTPWVRFGEDNEIELVVLKQDGIPGESYPVKITKLSLDFHA